MIGRDYYIQITSEPVARHHLFTATNATISGNDDLFSTPPHQATMQFLEQNRGDWLRMTGRVLCTSSPLPTAPGM